MKITITSPGQPGQTFHELHVALPALREAIDPHGHFHAWFDVSHGSKGVSCGQWPHVAEYIEWALEPGMTVEVNCGSKTATLRAL